jgi:hypothetical protein
MYCRVGYPCAVSRYGYLREAHLRVGCPCGVLDYRYAVNRSAVHLRAVSRNRSAKTNLGNWLLLSWRGPCCRVVLLPVLLLLAYCTSLGHLCYPNSHVG